VIASWTVLRPPTLPAFASMVPFVVLLVTLDEGVRLIGYLVDDAGPGMSDRWQRRGRADRPARPSPIP
jgi:hypothetical protein